MGPIGVPELLIILVLVLIVFGAGRLPDVMGSLGKGVSAFRKASTEDESEAAAKGVVKTEPKPASEGDAPSEQGQ